MANPNPSPATRWKPGQSGNPSGRPAGESFTTILRAALEAGHKKAPSWRHALVAKAVLMAAAGDLDAMKWIADRTDGKVKDHLELTGEGGGALRVEVCYRDESVRGVEP